MFAPKDSYPTQTIVAAGHPFGKARNDIVPGDGSGTPLEERWINDIWGFFAAALDAVEEEPNGTTEDVGESQVLDAIVALYSAGDAAVAESVSAVAADVAAVSSQLNGLESAHDARLDTLESFRTIARTFASFSFQPAAIDDGERFEINAATSESSPSGAFAWSSGRVTVPAAGTYEIGVAGPFSRPTSGLNLLALNLDADFIADAGPITGGGVHTVNLREIVQITSPSTQRVNVTAQVDGVAAALGARLIIKRLA
jgi:hypothetical protein